MLKPAPKPSMAKRKKRKKRTPFKIAWDKAEKAHSLHIRERDKACVTCGSSQNLTNGHLITRSKKSIFFDSKNCNCQCRGCNLKHEFNPEIYTQWFINRYGLVEYHDLIRRGNETKKWTKEELEQIAEIYS